MAITLFKNKTGSLGNPSSAKHCIRKQTSAEIIFKGDYVQGKYNDTVISSMRAQIGDTVRYINNTTVGCYDSNSNERGRVVASRAANTFLLEFTGSPIISNFTYTITSTESKSVVASGVVKQNRKYAVNVSAGSGGTGVYTSTSSTATSGNASGYKYAVYTRVYYFAKTTDAILANYHAPFALSTPVYNSNGEKYYCIGSVAVLGDKTVSVPALEPKPLTIYFDGVGTKGTSNGASVPYMTAYYGDYLSVSGSTVTCKYPSKETRGTVTASIMTDTIEGDFGGNVVLPTVSDEQITSARTITNEAGTAVKKKYAVTISGLGTAGSPTGYLSISSQATSGSNSGATFDYGTTVFAHAKIPHTTLSLYTTPASWEYNQQDSSNIYYIIGSLGQVTENTNNNRISVNSLSAKSSVTINLTGTGITWKNGTTVVSSMTAYVGDIIKNTSSTAVTCYYRGIDGGLNVRGFITANKSANTAQYKYTGTPTITMFEWELSSTISKSISAGGISRALQSYTISITKPSIATEAYVSSTSSTATGGSASGTFDYGTTVYGFVKMLSGDAAIYDLSAAGWTQVYSNGQYNGYRVGQLTVSGAASISYTTPPYVKAKVSITAGTDGHSAYVSTSSSASSGSSSGEFTYGTTIYGYAKVLITTAAYYNIPGTGKLIGSDSSYHYYRVGFTTTGTSSRTITYTNGTRKPITVNISAPSYVKATYLSTSGSTSGGNASGTQYAPGTTVYGYIKLDPTYFNANSSWTSVGQDSSGYICYRVGSVTVPTTLTNAAQTITAGNAVGLSATVYFSNTHVDWKINGSSVGYGTAYNGDHLIAANATVSCSDQDGNVRWTATATKKANTAQYTYTGTPTITLPYTTVMGTGTATVKGITRTVNKYTVNGYNGPTLLETDTVEYGTQPEYNGPLPTKASTAQYTYTWKNQWSTSLSTDGVADSSLPTVTGDVNYYAVGWNALLRSYAVTVTKPSIAEEIGLSTTNGASSGSSSGSSFNYGSTVYAMVKVNASIASIYNISADACGWTQTGATSQYNYYKIGSVNVTGAVTLTYTNPSKKSSIIYISASTGVSSVYLSTNSSATSGSASGTRFEYGIIYGFAKVASSKLSDYNIPDTWTHISYSGGYHYYCVGSTQADGSTSKTISYTAMTAKPQLSGAGVSLNGIESNTNYVLTVMNNNSIPVTVTGAGYNSSGTKIEDISSGSLGAYNQLTRTLAFSKADAVYASVTLSAPGYMPSTKTTNVASGKPQAPQVVSTDVTSENYEFEYTTDETYEYNKYIKATIKNPNTFQVTVIAESVNISDAVHRGSPSTLAAGATGNIVFSANAGGQMKVFFRKNSVASDTIYITCPSDGSGGQT